MSAVLADSDPGEENVKGDPQNQSKRPKICMKNVFKMKPQVNTRGFIINKSQIQQKKGKLLKPTI